MGLFSKGGIFSKILGAVPVVGGIASGIFDAASSNKQQNIQAGNSAENIRANQAQEAIARARLAEEARQADQSNLVSRYNAAENARQFGIDSAAKQEGTNFNRVQQNRFAKMRAPMITGLLQGRSLRPPPPPTGQPPIVNKFAPITGIGQ